MSEYVSLDDLETMSNDLSVYDVDQHGWEHEHKGLEFNLNHTLKELVRARRKDFFDPSVVRNELAPDATQFALRISRWTRFKTEFVLPQRDIDEKIDHHAILTRVHMRRLAAYSAAEILLADYVHKLDHASEHEAVQQTKFDALPRVSQALMAFALEGANEFNFSLKPVFTNRLNNLRERFGIQQPN